MKHTTWSLAVSACLLFACRETKEPEPTPTDDLSESVVDSATSSRIDSTLKAFVENGQVAGISALVYEKGKEAYFGAFGYADRAAGIAMDRNTIVQIYSMTKPITGVSLMTLYEDGAFELDDPLEMYLPEFGDVQVYKGVDAQGKLILEDPARPITVRDITRHTAGFPNRGDIPGLSEVLQKANIYNREEGLEQLGAKLAAVPLWFDPGTQWEYGPSVDVQAYLVQKISGQPFEQYTREHVLDPLGMTETRYLVPEEDRDRFSAMYRKTGDSLLQLPDEDAKSDYLQEWPLRRGGSGLTATIDNYMTFARMLLNEGSVKDTTILKPETIRLMATNQLADTISERNFLPSKGQVGFGIDFAVRLKPPINDEENYGVVGEFFWDGAASTLFWIDPKNDLAAVLFVQLFPYDPIGLHKGFRKAVYSGYVEEKE